MKLTRFLLSRRFEVIATPSPSDRKHNLHTRFSKCLKWLKWRKSYLYNILYNTLDAYYAFHHPITEPGWPRNAVKTKISSILCFSFLIVVYHFVKVKIVLQVYAKARIRKWTNNSCLDRWLYTEPFDKKVRVWRS